jgi:hypothetical protein
MKHSKLIALFGLVVAQFVLPVTANAVGVGKMCGGIAGIKCDTGLFCDPRPGLCGGADVDGKCVKPTKICIKIRKPVCGCDNKTYGNDCERIAAQVGKAHNGECKGGGGKY